MRVRAVGRYQRVSPMKARRIVDAIRNRAYPEALAIVQSLPSPTARIVGKVLRSAAANGEHNHDMDPERCRVAECTVDQALMLKRARYRAMGRVYRIRRRLSHITVVLSDNTD